MHKLEKTQFELHLLNRYFARWSRWDQYLSTLVMKDKLNLKKCQMIVDLLQLFDICPKYC